MQDDLRGGGELISVFDDASCTVYYNSSQTIIILCYIPWGGEWVSQSLAFRSVSHLL